MAPAQGPEMLELDFVSRRDSKAHDRRKRDYDIASHWACATGKSGDVVNEDMERMESQPGPSFGALEVCQENERRLDHNGPLLEYLRQQLRISVDAWKKITGNMNSDELSMSRTLIMAFALFILCCGCGHGMRARKAWLLTFCNDIEIHRKGYMKIVMEEIPSSLQQASQDSPPKAM
eukprot:Skav224242  [mRNA]  locus=scaffold939:1421756:1432199:- [translate_table: standard]